MITLMPQLARLSGNSGEFRALLQRAFEVMQLLAVPVLLLGVFAEELLVLIGGPAFRPAADALRLMLLALALAYMQTVLGHALVAQGRQRLALRVSLQVLVLNLVLNVALIPEFGIIGAAIALVVSELASLLLMWRRFRETGTPPRLRLSLAQCGAAAAMLIAFVGARWLGGEAGLSAAPLLLVGGALGSIAYLVALAGLGGLPPEAMSGLARLRRRRSAS
jgi:O-antigen/teichoic acid export membrane protein